MLTYLYFIYIPLYLFYLLSYLVKNNSLLIFPIFILVFFTSLRYMIGWDYVHYYDVVANGIDNNIILRGEYLTVFFVNVARYLDSPFFYFFTNSLLFFVFFTRFIYRYSCNIWLSYVIFLGLPLFYMNSLSVVRTFTAIAVVLYAFDFLIKRRVFLYVVLVFIASLFHTAALFSLLFPVFLYINPSALSLALVFVLAPYLKFFLFPVLTALLTIYYPSYLVYLEPAQAQEGTKAIFVLGFFGIIMLLMRNRFFLKDEKYNLMLNIYFLGILFYFMFLEFGTIGHRMTLYSTILLTVLLPFVISKLKHRSIRFSVGLFLHFLFASFFFYYLNLGGGVYIPYRTIIG